MKKLNNKGVSAIIITVLLVFVAVILGGILLSWGRGYTDKGVNQAQTVTETKYNASDFVYPEKIDAGVVKFRYSPPADLESQNIEITKYKIISENKESEEKTFNTPLILEEGVNTFDLENFFDLGVADSKVTVVLITSDNKYINLENISNTNAKRLKVETPTADPIDPIGREEDIGGRSVRLPTPKTID